MYIVAVASYACVCVAYVNYALYSFHRNAESIDEIDEPQNQNYNTFQESLLDYTSNN